EVVELGEALGEDLAGVLVGGGAVGQRREDHHGVTVVGHHEMEPVDGEVGSDQGTVNLDPPGVAWTAPARCVWAGPVGRTPPTMRGCCGGGEQSVACPRNAAPWSPASRRGLYPKGPGKR